MMMTDDDDDDNNTYILAPGPSGARLNASLGPDSWQIILLINSWVNSLLLLSNGLFPWSSTGGACMNKVSVKSKLQHSPPPGKPPGIWLFWKLLFKFPPTRAKMPFKCPTLGSVQVIKCPHPGDISQAHKWQKDGRNSFSCRTKSL